MNFSPQFLLHFPSHLRAQKSQFPPQNTPSISSKIIRLHQKFIIIHQKLCSHRAKTLSHQARYFLPRNTKNVGDNSKNLQRFSKKVRRFFENLPRYIPPFLSRIGVYNLILPNQKLIQAQKIISTTHQHSPPHLEA